MRVNFNLRATTPNTKRQPINAVIRWNGKRLVYSTNCKVFPKNWNADKQRVKNVLDEPTKDATNVLLADFEAAISKFQAAQIAPYVPTMEEFKIYLDSIFAPSVSETGENTPVIHTLFSFVDLFIQERKEHATLSKTAVKYNQMRIHLKAFAIEKKRNIDYKNVNIEFFDDFVKYLYSKNLKQNSCNKIISLLKAVLNDATERGYNSSLIYKSRKFNVSTEDVKNVYLTIGELDKLLKFDFSKMPSLDRVRDLFLVGCWTGLRFSDFTNIKPENFTNSDGDEYLELKTIKTEQNVTIPVHPVVKSIFNKYGGAMPKALSNQKMNKYLKEVCKAVGFYDLVPMSATVGGKRVDSSFPKYDLITTHTGRRSFATNAFKSGEMSPLEIMFITGHTTETSFRKYIKITGEENAKRVGKTHFFKGTNKEPSELKKVS